MARRPVPGDLEDALAVAPAARERFWSLPPDQLDRWVSYVERARFPGQRRRRIAETVRRLGGVPAVPQAQAVAVPRGDRALWLAGLALLAALAGLIVWLTQYRHDRSAGSTTAVVLTAKTSVPKVTGIKLQAALFQLREAKLGVKLVKRAGTKPKDIVVGQGPRARKTVAQGTVVTLVVSKGPAGVRVPQLVGLAAADAVKQLQAKGLGAQLQQTQAKAAPGTVVEQAPKAGERSKRGTVVTLSVAKGAAAVAVPDVVGQPEQAAVNALQQAGLNARVVHVRSSQPPGTVTGQTPAAGAQAGQGSTVRVNVATGAPQTTATTPTTTQTRAGNDYRGMRLGAAVQRIAQGRQQAVVQYVTSSQPAGVVVANANAPGGKVKLQVSAGAHPQPAATVTDDTGADEQTAQDNLTGAGFSVIVVHWPVSDPASDGVVVAETPTGSEPQGLAIVLYVGTAQ
ncbi:MAG: PASTA domain-containing protein [Actinomycetota bacterium]